MPNGIVDKIKERLESGIAFVIGAYGNDYLSERFTRKYLKEYAELVDGIGIALVLDIIGLREKIRGYEPYIDKISDALSDYGFWKGAEFKVIKVPLCWFNDGNTIQCINFDADDVSTTYVKVYVDDSGQTVSATSGTPDNFTISLANAVASGWHKLMVIAGNTKKDSVSRKTYTP